DTLSGIENATGTAQDDIFADTRFGSNSYQGGETNETVGDTVYFNDQLGGAGAHFVVTPTGVDGDDFSVQYFNASNVLIATDTLTDIEHLVFTNTTLNADAP